MSNTLISCGSISLTWLNKVHKKQWAQVKHRRGKKLPPFCQSLSIPSSLKMLWDYRRLAEQEMKRKGTEKDYEGNMISNIITTKKKNKKLRGRMHNPFPNQIFFVMLKKPQKISELQLKRQ